MLSIIVPVYNDEKNIRSCLESICQSDYTDYELIVVDDCSTDKSQQIAHEYTNNVFSMKQNSGAGAARNFGVEKAKGNILVFIDSDVIILKNTLAIIYKYFESHPQVDGVTGLLAKEHPHTGFFSQYKNLYMNYIFNKLPTEVNFLYGSTHAIRKTGFIPYLECVSEDTELGQKMSQQGKHIHFIRELEVIHLKKHTFASFIRNDFKIPYSWAKIFIKHRGWKQLGKTKTGYAHSPKEQILSIAIVGIICLCTFLYMFFPVSKFVFLALLCSWLFLNAKFLFFLGKERGVLFFFHSVYITFIDHFVMGNGIFWGFISSLLFTQKDFVS